MVEDVARTPTSLRRFARSCAREVNTTYALLAHGGFSLSGEVFAGANGQTKCVFIAQTQWRGTLERTADDLRDNGAELMREHGYSTPPDRTSDKQDWAKTCAAPYRRPTTHMEDA